MMHTWDTLPYYFGRHSARLEANAEQYGSERVVRSAGPGLGAALLAAREAAPRLLVGGDCFTALPVVFAHRDEIEHVYWFDAHGDFNDETTTNTGFLGGMPFAALSGHALPRLLEHLGETPIDAGACTHVAGRSWDEGERERALAAGVEVIDRPPSRMPVPSHVHIDVDCFDLAEVPNVTHPEPGGLPVAEVARFLAENADLVTSVSVSAWRIETPPPRAVIQLLRGIRLARRR